MSKIHIDFETRSSVDLGSTGIKPYAESEYTEVLMFSYKINDEETKIWIKDTTIPEEVIKAIEEGYIVCGHNVMFEYYIWNITLRRIYPILPQIKFENTSCTMCRAVTFGMPPSLDKLAEVVNAEIKKDKIGAKLMKEMCKPKNMNKDGSINGDKLIYKEDEESIKRLAEYCIDDTNAEYYIDKKIPELSEDEKAYRIMDFNMQERGIYLDVQLIEGLQYICNTEKASLDNQMQIMTNNKIDACSKRKQIVDEINSNGFALKSLAKDDISDAVKAVAGNDYCSKLLDLYINYNKSSVEKFTKMMMTMCNDIRHHGLFQYNGAFTGRWSGRLWQPQNLPRFDEETEGDMIRNCINIIKTRSKQSAYEEIKTLYANHNILNIASSCIRSCISGEGDKVLVGADYSNIEGRVMAFIAGADLKIQKFIEQDSGGNDMYKVAYSASFGVPIESITKKERQIGKTQELALQYGGSISALLSYNINPSDITQIILPMLSEDEFKRSEFYYEQCKPSERFGLSKSDFIGLHNTVKRWRNSELNLPIFNFWNDIESAFIKAYRNPGVIQYIGKTRKAQYMYRQDMDIMWLRLPTGKLLAYHKPKLEEGRFNKLSISAMSYSSTKFKWYRKSYYGGKLANHIIQGTAAEIMKRGMLNISNKFDLTMTVHDEAVAEVFIAKEDEDKILLDFKNCMCAVGNEFKGLPLKAEGWVDKRYVK